jgi:hypothetical protein
MKVSNLKKILEVLEETGPDVEDFSWGPTYEMALKRRKEAIAIVEEEIAWTEELLREISPWLTPKITLLKERK